MTAPDPRARFTTRGMPMADRVMYSICVDIKTQCWNWTRTINRFGYGSVYHGPRRGYIGAHRLSWEVFCGPIPDGLQLDHLCRNRRCVNPEHLEPVTPRVNNLRGEGAAAINARKTHCARGHEYTPETMRHSEGKRACRACDVIRNRTYRQRKLEALA